MPHVISPPCRYPSQPWRCPTLHPELRFAPSRSCCKTVPPDDVRIAVCIVGNPHIFTTVERSIQDNVIAPLGSAADAFLATSRPLLRVPRSSCGSTCAPPQRKAETRTPPSHDDVFWPPAIIRK